MSFWVQFLLVTISVAVADVCWTMWFLKTANRNAVKAGIWSALVILFGAFSTISWIDDRRFLIASMIGAFLGTWITIKYFDKKDDEPNSKSISSE